MCSAREKSVSWLETELREQPAALARLLDQQGAHAAELAAVFRRDDVRYVLIASRGSSSNAARYAQYVLGRANRVPVMFATPSLYTIYEQPPRLDGAIVIGISQSGASPDVRAVLAEARRQSRPTIALTNDPSSPLASEAEHVLPLEAGEEKAVAATKTYLNSLGAIALMFAAISDDAVARAELERMPGLLEEQIELAFEPAPELASYMGVVGATVVARGVNYGTAFEIALKIRELSGLMVEAYSPADLMHGPIAAIRPGWPVVVVAPSGPAHDSVAELVPALVARQARLLAVSDVPELLAQADTALPLVAGVPEWLSPLVAVIPGQVTAMRLARLRGLDVDNPAGLRKVTLTR
jgi:glutamine---fructose-6-phosphate transaminase (isomerizing)